MSLTLDDLRLEPKPQDPKDACAWCKTKQGEENVKLLHCSRCSLNTRYCGKACQVAHWPTHKSACRRAASAMEQLERSSLASPRLAIYMQQDLNYLSGIKKELIYAARSALRIGHTESLRMTHYLLLRVDYDPSKPTYSQQHIYKHAQVRSLAEDIKSEEFNYGGSLQEIIPVHPPSARGGPMDPTIAADAIEIAVNVEVDVESSGRGGILTHREQSPGF
ncbi:hypothetical protein BCR35DRAFT_112703 [Leucosporidium creatinivorum]|uniref:MYND-type domain-containing protein n=1 Tax=Leucosporidium creatinivorum TaxID=106004 RepID=A0A1Y2F0Z9_9BASI|nr:hypothetical protein BCR35DRAFT_112703 [Leucosporidium creatinivorum]